MVHAEIPQRRPWLTVAWLVTFAFAALMSVLNLYVGVMIAGMAIMALVALALGVAPRASVQVPWRASVRRSITTDEQLAQVAFVVPAESTPGYTPMLTRNGYVLVNEAGSVVYTLK